MGKTHVGKKFNDALNLVSEQAEPNPIFVGYDADNNLVKMSVPNPAGDGFVMVKGGALWAIWVAVSLVLNATIVLSRGKKITPRIMADAQLFFSDAWVRQVNPIYDDEAVA